MCTHPRSQVLASTSSRMSSTRFGAKGFSRRSRSRRSLGASQAGGSKGEAMAWSVGAGLEGKGVIVTGAAGGIGQAVTRAFDTTGARVMAVELDQAKPDQPVARLAGPGPIGVAAELPLIPKHHAPV